MLRSKEHIEATVIRYIIDPRPINPSLIEGSLLRVKLRAMPASRVRISGSKPFCQMDTEEASNSAGDMISLVITPAASHVF